MRTYLLHRACGLWQKTYSLLRTFCAVSTCDLSTCQDGGDPEWGTRTWDNPGRAQIEVSPRRLVGFHCDASESSRPPDQGWIADGCQDIDDDEPCSFMRLMEVTQEAVRHNDTGALGSHPVYRACAEARRHMGEAVIAGSCDRGP